MKCKNCQSGIQENDNFCRHCGAEVVKERITLKSLYKQWLNAFGWDSKFFTTLRYMLYKPQMVLKAYLSGTRKKYTPPFTFLTIILAVSVFVYNQYSGQFIRMVTTHKQVALKYNSSSIDMEKSYMSMGFKNQMDFQKKLAKLELKYYNLILFLTLPFNALLAFLVFGKPYNYGEHLVINTYITSIATFLGVFIFVLGLLTKINLLPYLGFISLVYIFFVYHKLYNFSTGKLLIKLLKYAGIWIFLIIIFALISIPVIFILNMIKSSL